MKKSPPFSLRNIVVGSLILIGFTTWIFTKSDWGNLIDTSKPARSSVNQTGLQLPQATPEIAQEISQLATKTEFHFTRISQPPVDLPPQQKSPLLQGWAETATLVDKTGQTLLKASPTAPIYSVIMSPAEDQVILSRGGGVHQVYRLSPFSIICELPLSPNLPRASAFDNWQWIDNRKLLGVSSTTKSTADLEGFTWVRRRYDVCK
jgi:hypothetical protein